MTYFDDVLETIKVHNPIDATITLYEKQMKKADEKLQFARKEKLRLELEEKFKAE